MKALFLVTSITVTLAASCTGTVTQEDPPPPGSATPITHGPMNLAGFQATDPSFQRFAVKGSLAASTSSVTDSEAYCHYEDGTFTLQTDAMRVGKGPAVARLSVSIPGFDGVGRYSATIPLQQYSRRTPIYLATSRDTASGAATSQWGATRGHIRIASVTPLDTPRHRAVVEGAVSAILRQRFEGNGGEISAQGSWRCKIGEWP